MIKCRDRLLTLLSDEDYFISRNDIRNFCYVDYGLVGYLDKAERPRFPWAKE